jgi:hypothetical protein
MGDIGRFTNTFSQRARLMGPLGLAETESVSGHRRGGLDNGRSGAISGRGRALVRFVISVNA